MSKGKNHLYGSSSILKQECKPTLWPHKDVDIIPNIHIWTVELLGWIPECYKGAYYIICCVSLTPNKSDE